MKQYTTKDFEEMKQLKKDYEEVGMELTVGVIQRRLRVGLETAKAIYNDLNATEEKDFQWETTVEWSFSFYIKEVTTMYRPQYLEQKREVITVHKGNGEKVYEYRRLIKRDTYKWKENNEVIPLYGKRTAKH